MFFFGTIYPKLNNKRHLLAHISCFFPLSPMNFCSVHRLFDALAHDITQTGYGLEAALRGTRQAGGAEVPGGGGSAHTQ